MSSYKQHLAAVSSFRIPCAIFVFLHHMEGHFGVPHSSFPFRQMVVSAFLLISGYLLHSIYGPRAKDMSAGEFYRKRLIRIYPLHGLILVFTFVLNWEQEKKYLLENFWFAGSKFLAHLSLLQCWYPSQQFVLGLNGVTWTLSVILFCYLLFPWLARTGNRLWMVFVGILVFDGLLLAWMVPRWSFETISPRNLVHFFPMFRMLEFILGMMLAQYGQQSLPHRWQSRRWMLTVVDLFVVAVALWSWEYLQVKFASSLFWVSQPEIKRVYNQWFQLCGFAIPASLVLYWYSLSNGWVAGGMRSRLMVFLGGVSYAFYLCHRPICLKAELCFSYLPWSPTAAVVILFFVVLLISTLLFLFAELPARRLFGGSPPLKPASQPTLSTERNRSHRIDNFCAIVVLTVGIGWFACYQADWPARTVIRFQDGIQLSLNRAVMENSKLRLFFGWSLPQFETPFMLGYHLLDDRQQIIESQLWKRFEPKESGETGVFWLTVAIDERSDVDSVAIFCRQVKGGNLLIENADSSTPALADQTGYIIWNRQDKIKTRRSPQ